MSASFCLFCGSRSGASVAFGSLANASLVGANTVNGPLPASVSARPAAFTALTSVEKSGLADATSTIDWPIGLRAAGDTPGDAGGAVVAGDELDDLSLDEHAPSARPAAATTQAQAPTRVERRCNDGCLVG